MRSGCIEHPKREPLIKIHRWQVEICDGDVTAAALLSFFEYWHDIKLEMSSKTKRSNDIAQMHGDDRIQDESLLQFHTEQELIDGIMIAKRDSIRKGIRLLESKGFISIHKNPNPRYAFDKTRYFLFHPELVNGWLCQERSVEHECEARLPEDSQGQTSRQSSKSENQRRGLVDRLRQVENQLPQAEIALAITEITPEITSETTTETLPVVALKNEISITDKQIDECCTQILVVSKDVKLNFQVRSAIATYWANFPAALQRLKKAVNEGWKCNLTGVLVKALKEGVPEDEVQPITIGWGEWSREAMKRRLMQFSNSQGADIMVHLTNGRSRLWSEIKSLSWEELANV